MRRLWAYIITTLTALLIVGVTFSTVFLKMNSVNWEYQSGKELVFRISDKENEDVDLEELDNTEAIDNIVEVMEQRLKKTGLTSYNIKKVGKDTVKVGFSDASGNDHYSLISNYLTFNGSLAITDAGEKVALMNEFRNEKKDAYVTEENSIPKIVIPVNKDNPEFQAVIESAHTQAEEAANQETDEESEESSATYIYLWYDFIEEVDSYTNSLDDETMAKKILIPFDISLYSKDEETGEYPDELATPINVDTNSDNSASVAELKEGFYRANYFVNLLNAGELDYKVTYLYSNDIDASFESLTVLGEVQENLAFSATLRAVLISFVVITLILISLYRLGSLAGVATTTVTLFGTLGFIILFGVEFNTATIVGLVITAIVSLASVVVYQKKFRDEAYRGRSIKKANSEGAKKALLPIVDINAASIIVGAFVYLLGGTMMRGLAAGLVLGGVISLILNTLALRGLMWMATNATKLTGKYNAFGIDESKVPDLTSEEKQTYYGAFATSDFTSKKKPVYIVTLILTVASIAGMIVFGSLNKGQIFNNTVQQTVASEIHFEAVDREYAYSETTIRNLLSNMLIYEEGKEESALQSVSSLLKDDQIVIPDTLTEKVKENDHVVEHIHYFYVAPLNKNLSLETVVYLKDSAFPGFGADNRGTINEVLASYNASVGGVNDIARLKNITLLTPDFVGFEKITLGTFIGVVVLSVYLTLRYRPARGIASLLGMSVSGAIVMGIFSLTRFPVSSYVLAMLPGVVIIAAIFAIAIMNKDREMQLEDRSRDFNFEHKQENMLKANSYAFSISAVVAAISLLIVISFFGFSVSAASHFYTFLFIGIAVAVAIIAILFAPTALFFQKLFSKINIERKPRKSKKKAKAKPKASKSAEPEEAIFIGIND